MKRILVTLSLIFAFSLAVSAQTKTTLVNKREKNQKQRIVKGVKSGDLTFKETGKLLKQQAAIRKAEKKAKSDGNVTLAERFRLHRQLNQAGRNIKNKKTN